MAGLGNCSDGDGVKNRLFPRLVLCGGLVAPYGVHAAAPDLAPVRQWIERASQVKSLSVDFVQERYLKSVTRPLITPGRMYFKAPGSLRWQLGEPPKLIALQEERGGEFFLLEPREKKGQRFAGGSAGDAGRQSPARAILEASFPTTLEAFQERCRVTAVNHRDGSVIVEARLNDRRLSVAVMAIRFVIEEETSMLQRFEIDFRDASRIVTKFVRVEPNAKVPAEAFRESLEGYAIETVVDR